jgi:hypothetical protein
MAPTVRREGPVLVWLGLFGFLAAQPVRADVGPPGPAPRKTFLFHVTRDGNPLAGESEVVLLSPTANRSLRWKPPAPPEWLKKVSLRDADGTEWHPTLQGSPREGALEFSEGRRGRGAALPNPFRLAIYQQGDDKVFLTAPTYIRSPYRSLYQVDLADDEATVTAVSPLSPLFWRGYVWPVLLAAVGTFFLQVCVAMAWVASLYRTPPRPFGRVFLVCLITNVVLAPLLPGLTLWLRMLLGSYETSLGVFLGLQGLAAAVQAVLYSWVGRLPLRGAAGLAATANLASLGFSCCIVSVPGWYL